MIARRHVFWSVFCIAAAIRGFFLVLFSGTRFRYYHMVPGLDMQTLLHFSEWGVNGGEIPPFFTPHRIVIHLLWRLNGFVHAPGMLFLIQSLVGIAGALALADLTLMLTGKRKLAIFAGIADAVYLPLLIYECSVLQDSFAVNFAVLAVWGLFRARRCRFSLASALGCGALWAIALMGRPTLILLAPAAFAGSLWYCCRRKLLRRWLPMAAATLVLLAGAAGFNAAFGWKYGPFYHVLPYTLSYNAEVAAAAGKPSEPSLAASTLAAAGRVPQLFGVRELPENQNLYFWRYKLPEVQLFPGPELLLPLTIGCMVMLLLSGRFGRKEFLVWYPIILLALPLCAREAIGRYRLMLIPFFLWLCAASFAVFPHFNGRRKKLFVLCCGAAGALVCVLWSYQEGSGLRSSDFLSWALASEAKYGHCDETLDACYDYWQKTAFRSDRAFCAVERQAYLCRRSDVAEKALRQAELIGAVEPSLCWYFRAVAGVGRNDAAAVAECCRRIDPGKLPPELRENFLRFRRDAAAILHEQEKRRLNNTSRGTIL